MDKQTPLHILQMGVIWRDTFSIDNAGKDFLELSHKRLAKLPITVATTETRWNKQPELLRVIERTSRGVAGLGHGSLLRFQFKDVHAADLRPTLNRLRRGANSLLPAELQQVASDADTLNDWVMITPVLLLHKAGVGVLSYHAEFITSTPGYTPEQAIDLVRTSINPQLINLPDVWLELLPDTPGDWHFDHVIPGEKDKHLVVSWLRDLSRAVVVPLLDKSPEANDAQQAPYPTGSSTVVLVETAPQCGDLFEPFIEQHGRALRGIGAMDNYYHERAYWIIDRELHDNLSTDAEMSFYLLGNSELIVMNKRAEKVHQGIARRLKLRAHELAVVYSVMHYGVLMEWIYIQDAILRRYIQRLDELATSPHPERSAMIDALQNALTDMVQYQEHITPYANRIEFLERAGAFHKLPQLVERFERKQDMLINYFSEYHDYRDARATEMLNRVVGALAAFELAALLVNGFQFNLLEEPLLFILITAGSIILIYWLVSFILERARR